ncbi:hypothetical protein BJ138DRAFT_1110963 [Hygrophoropsis aurantiaca]|uniref:Uncharacterized protein n=1 Tax=Hygrophoropsis aurantiaca TaxID=72124 RepID=A0ACB8AL97_9AGAM|nr:hypothetical protein BJ138DRAFT_1110963 [Hygrophoropsis aurantiaca]
MISSRTTNYGYYNPADGGGSLITAAQGTYPPGLGEPINVIISAYSDSDVLQPTTENGGLINYYQSFGFSTECLGQHAGDNQGANLGDGNGYLNQSAVIRWDYGDATLGTCEETIEGGDHIRYWIQDGKDADSGAIFMAVSYEMPIAEQHNIVPNGYNLGRDWLVGNATAQPSLIPTLLLTSPESFANASSSSSSGSNSSTTTTTPSSYLAAPYSSSLSSTLTYSGSTSFNNYTYHTTAQYVSGLLSNTSVGINHYQTVPVDGGNAIDGLVVVLTVKITGKPQGSG